MRVLLGLSVLALFGLLNAVENRPAVPAQLVINGDTWNVYEVAKVEDNQALLGYADCPTHVIEILKSDSDRSKADTLAHEFLHAATCDKDGVHNDKYDNDDDGHEGIYFAAGRITDFIADNPRAVEYIQWARGGKK